MILEAKNFSNRQELENEIRKSSGHTTDLKPGDEVQGTKAELERLQLSDQGIIWGLKIICTDSPTVPTGQIDKTTPERGEIKPSGINGEIKNKPK